MRRGVSLISAVAFGLFLVCAIWLGRLERGGPAHVDLALEGEIPATLYLPSESSDPFAFFDPPEPGARPAAVALMHGFATDRHTVSSLARRLAGAGYAVLTFDARGHGENRQAAAAVLGRPDRFADDFASAVAFLRGTPLVDGARIALMGHSMGAGAALDYATRDSGIDAAVMVSGGWALLGPHRPPNALFIYADNDPGWLRARSDELASRLAGVEAIERGRTYPGSGEGDAVRMVSMPGENHATILWSEPAAREIAAWLDLAFELDGASRAHFREPRLVATVLALLALLGALPGFGLVLGRLAGPLPERPAANAQTRIAVFAAALAAALPVLAVGHPGALFSLEVGSDVVVYLSLAGIAMLAWYAWVSELDTAELRHAWLGGALAGVAASIGFYVLLQPLHGVVVGLGFTPERATLFALSFAALFPFGLAFQWSLRRGRPLQAATGAVIGRLLVLAVVALGAVLGLTSPVVLLQLPFLVVIFAMMELFAAGLYAASRNVLALAVFDAAAIALVITAIMPVRL